MSELQTPHVFSVSIAKIVGVEAAVIYQNLMYWCKQNEANGRNFYDGRYWTYNSAAAFVKQFPYFSERQVSRLLEKLEENGLIISGNYNQNKFDRTKWYSTNYIIGESISQEQEVHFTKTSNGDTENDASYTNVNHIENSNEKPNTLFSDLEQKFELFRKKYQGTKRGLSTELSVLKKHKDWKEVVNELSSILDRQTKERELRQAKGEFVPQWPNLQTYLNQRRWEEEVKIETPTGNRIPKQERNNVMQGTILTAYVPK